MSKKPIILALLMIMASSTQALFAYGKGGNVNTANVYKNYRLVGTAWGGKGFGGRYKTWYFLRGGRLRYTTPEGSYINGTWRRTGNSIYVEKNNRFSQYRGVIRGNIMSGRAWNTKGQSWSWTRRRQR